MAKNETKDDALDAVGVVDNDAKAAELAAKEAELEAKEAELVEQKRIADVEAQQREVDRREEAMAKKDEVIDNYQSGRKAKPGQPFIDRNGREHRGNCNSHPSKRKPMRCDCGRNGTMRYRGQ